MQRLASLLRFTQQEPDGPSVLDDIERIPLIYAECDRRNEFMQQVWTGEIADEEVLTMKAELGIPPVPVKIYLNILGDIFTYVGADVDELKKYVLITYDEILKTDNDLESMYNEADKFLLEKHIITVGFNPDWVVDKENENDPTKFTVVKGVRNAKEGKENGRCFTKPYYYKMFS